MSILREEHGLQTQAPQRTEDDGHSRSDILHDSVVSTQGLWRLVRPWPQRPVGRGWKQQSMTMLQYTVSRERARRPLHHCSLAGAALCTKAFNSKRPSSKIMDLNKHQNCSGVAHGPRVHMPRK
eukprot:3488849-Amphidinium_carterae.1